VAHSTRTTSKRSTSWSACIWRARSTNRSEICPGIWDQAAAFGAEGKPGQQVLVLTAGRGKVRLERVRVRPGAGQASLERIQPPEAVVRPEEHVAERGREQRDLGADADPLPRLQTARKLLRREGSCQLDGLIEPHASHGSARYAQQPGCWPQPCIETPQPSKPVTPYSCQRHRVVHTYVLGAKEPQGTSVVAMLPHYTRHEPPILGTPSHMFIGVLVS
jgi:hypothetical protein